MSDYSLYSACITFEPTDEQLAKVGDQLLAVVNLGMSAIYDNSATPEAHQRVRSLCESTGIACLGGEGNVGTGKALNVLLREAEAAGCPWMFYFDQDSILPGAYGQALSTWVNTGPSLPSVAAIGSRIHYRGADDTATSFVHPLAPVRFLIASGTAFNVQIALNLGGFDASMFLDTVDHEFCLRARRAGMSLLQDNTRVIDHEIGTASVLVSRRFDFRVNYHPNWRRKMMWLNSVILVRRYIRTFPAECTRHIAGRTLETLLGTLIYRETSFLTAAVRGLTAGLRIRNIDRTA